MQFILLLLLCINAPASNAESFLDRLPSLGGSKQPSFLPPDKAFGLDVNARDAQTVQANFSVTPGYYLYRDKISFTSKDGATKVTAIKFPKG